MAETSFERDWRDPRNVSGFAAACARLALASYTGPSRSHLAETVEVVERHAGGEDINLETAATARSTAHCFSGAIANCAYYAAATVYKGPMSSIVPDALRAVRYAGEAGADRDELHVAFARWAVRDLSPRWPIDEELRQAAGAAIIAGDEELARELVQEAL